MTIQTQVVDTPYTFTFPAGKQADSLVSEIVLREWFRTQKIYIKDHILVTVEDWEQGIFRVERERFGEQRPDFLSERNRLVADRLYEMLESARSEDIYCHTHYLCKSTG